MKVSSEFGGGFVKDSASCGSFVIFMYSTIHLLKKDKIRFYYSLKGRDGVSGIVKRLNIRQLGRTVLLVSEEHSSEVRMFLQGWKCKFGVLEVLKKEEILV